MSVVEFWLERSLDSFTQDEWESLCDGCGLCCLHKLEDDESGEIFYTRVACHLLNIEQCRCTDYDNRFARVPSCVKVTPELAAAGTGLPSSCAYRLIANGQTLPQTHPLWSSAEPVKAGGSTDGKSDKESAPESAANIHSLSFWAVSEEYIQADEMEEHIIHWVEQ